MERVLLYIMALLHQNMEWGEAVQIWQVFLEDKSVLREAIEEGKFRFLASSLATNHWRFPDMAFEEQVLRFANEVVEAATGNGEIEVPEPPSDIWGRLIEAGRIYRALDDKPLTVTVVQRDH